MAIFHIIEERYHQVFQIIILLIKTDFLRRIHSSPLIHKTTDLIALGWSICRICGIIFRNNRIHLLSILFWALNIRLILKNLNPDILTLWFCMWAILLNINVNCCNLFLFFFLFICNYFFNFILRFKQLKNRTLFWWVVVFFIIILLQSF